MTARKTLEAIKQHTQFRWNLQQIRLILRSRSLEINAIKM
jgi:hypothetical protein